MVKIKILVNEKEFRVTANTTAFTVKQIYKANADMVILNGFIINKDAALKENDTLTLIKRGEIPLREELESLLIARHSPSVHNRIKNARVAIAGLGGLGSNIAVSLARIGIGHLTLLDFDIVEPCNLNRQQYFIKHIGMKKTEALKDLLYNINPYVEVKTQDIFIEENNIEQLFKDANIIVEALDSAVSKATLINTVMLKMPHKIIVSASGVAGYFSNNTIITKKIKDNFYLIGDSVSEAKPGCGLMAPRVAIAANHQANTVLRILMDEKDV